MTQTIAIGSCGPAWKADVAMGDQPGVADHLAFMGDLVQRGILESAGPFAGFAEPLVGDVVGLVVFAQDDPAEAERVLAGDPATLADLVIWRVHRWHR